ncbi:hypothetical protein ZHAS_00016449 [Anopheles sinensis]|uniref:Uncharacterized protein n=1 Tax=Anopheles sinensis TaxID=74873 RepID=A0A084WE21_ANOSI|nr:hypothetical protein ZHAS_00016449 [Anopheles sinensis]
MDGRRSPPMEKSIQKVRPITDGLAFRGRTRDGHNPLNGFAKFSVFSHGDEFPFENSPAHCAKCGRGRVGISITPKKSQKEKSQLPAM